ncbi:MAG: DUF58 domain-containing protein, partial [Planctomycetales bacterium]|nr:DUF58 domain-containing protein [Planctomycetales bacterium]
MEISFTARVVVLLALLGLTFGSLVGYTGLVALACGLLLWIACEVLWFRFQVAYQMRTAAVERNVYDRTQSVRSLWEGRTYDVKTTVQMRPSVGWSDVFISLTDLYPSSFPAKKGYHSFWTAPQQAVPRATLTYQIVAHEIGVAKFRGVRFRFTSSSGFFAAVRVLATVDHYVVSPLVFQFGTAFPLLKLSNRLSPPGIHTHHRPGSGSELLEIREYAPGDPPKSIAWKLTARRDQLMSKQLESEVPLRCTLFVDRSASVYLRADKEPVVQPSVRVAATLIEFLTSTRDPVGTITFDGSTFDVQPHSATRRASLRMIRNLTTAATDIPEIPKSASNLQQLIRLGLALSSNVYPELHANAAQHFGLHVTSAMRFRRGVLKRRYRLATILCALYERHSFDVSHLLYDDHAMAGLLQRFLLEHQWGLGPTRASLDLENIADPRKVENLVRLLRHSLARSRDQERFVILADLLHVADHLAPLASVIRTAQGQGHKVSVVCAWEGDAAEPPRVNDDLPKATRNNARELFTATQKNFLNRRFRQLQKELAKAQVRVIG